VFHTTLDARQFGYECVIVEDCTKGVAETTIEVARKNCKDQDVQYLTSEEVVELFKVAKV
jgi:nicotinamidase-related amidase